MGLFKFIGGVATPFLQKKLDYWYKVNGKKVTYEEYKRAHKEGVDGRRPNLQTNDPDPFGYKAKHKADREKLRKPTVLTEEQTKVKEEQEKKK
jgi:hypothetical protein